MIEFLSDAFSLRWVKEEDRRKDLAMIQYGDVAEVDEEVKSSNTETSVVEGGVVVDQII